MTGVSREVTTSPGTDTPPSILEQENHDLLDRVTDLQQENWKLEEKVCFQSLFPSFLLFMFLCLNQLPVFIRPRMYMAATFHLANFYLPENVIGVDQYVYLYFVGYRMYSILVFIFPLHTSMFL